MSDSVRPQRRQPTRLPHPWDSPGKNNGVGCHFLLQCMKVKSESEVAQSCLTLATPWTIAGQVPLSMGSSRHEYWSGLPCSPPGDLPDPGIKPMFLMSPAGRRVLYHCCCCCQVASVVSDSVRPHRRQPTRLPCLSDPPGKNTGVGCHFLLQCMKVKEIKRRH